MTKDRYSILIDAFMEAEQCSGATARHAFARVGQFLGFRDPDRLLDVIEAAEAESLTASPIGIRQARFLRSYYDCAIESVLPLARQGFVTIIENAQHVAFTNQPRRH